MAKSAKLPEDYIGAQGGGESPAPLNPMVEEMQLIEQQFSELKVQEQRLLQQLEATRQNLLRLQGAYQVLERLQAKTSDRN